MKSAMISLAQMDFSKISLCFTVLLHKAHKHILGVLFIYGGNIILLLIMRVFQQIQIQYETRIFYMLNLYCPKRPYDGLKMLLVNGPACHRLVSVFTWYQFKCPC
jgi:hypothetical protein